MRRFDDLSDQEVLALAISSEEEDGRIYRDFAHGLETDFPDTARMFVEMAEEEGRHRANLIDIFVERFGDHIPLVRRQDVRGFVQRKPIWQVRGLGVEAVRNHAHQMEADAARFYRQAAARTSDAQIRKLLGTLADAEDGHEDTVNAIAERNLTPDKRGAEDESARRRFVLHIVQPGLVGLMDGSVSTLAPVFAAAFATHNTGSTFQVGLAASVGAGISMGFAEALADDGKLSGRGTPVARGAICGLMTMLGGIGHTIPYLVGDFWTATLIAIAVVILELAVISWIRWRYMDTAPVSAMFQVMVGGALVFACGVLIGSG